MLSASWARRFGEPGPLIDVISIDAGASYLRESALSVSWHTGFRSIVPSEQDENLDRFCNLDDVNTTGSFTAALDRCAAGGAGGAGGKQATSTSSGNAGTLEAKSEWWGCWDGYAAWEDPSVGVENYNAHVYRTEMLRFAGKKGTKSLLARCESICKGYPHLGLSVRPASPQSTDDSMREADCTCGFHFDFYRKEKGVAKAATAHACGGDLGAQACGSGPCGSGQLTAVYKLVEPKPGLRYTGCRRGYVDFETWEAASSSSSSSSSSAASLAGAESHDEEDEPSKSPLTRTAAPAAAAAAAGSRRMLADVVPTAGVSRRSIGRLTGASAVMRVDAPIAKDGKVGGEKGALQQCVQACRGYPYLATALAKDKGVLKCTCGFRLQEFDTRSAAHSAITAPDWRGNACKAEANEKWLCNYGPCGIAGPKGAESVFALPGAFAFKDVKSLVYQGCFRSDPSAPTLAKRAGGRGKVTEGTGFATLQSCAKACDRFSTPYSFVGMNKDGCFCGEVAPDANGPTALPIKACQESPQDNPNECGPGPCGGDNTHMSVYFMEPDNNDIAGGSPGSGGVKHAGPGNVIVEARVVLATAFAADWDIRGEGFGIDGRLEVIQRGEVILAVDAPRLHPASPAIASSSSSSSSAYLGGGGESEEEPRVIEARAALLPGTYTVLLYGVYDAAAERSARGDASPAILFREPRYCNMTEWTSLKQGALDCDVPHLRAEAATPKSKKEPAVQSYKDELPASELEVDEDTGETTRKNPEYDGAYMDLHMGPPKLSLDPNDWFNFHFFFKGVFSLLGMSIIIDISIKAGKAEDGGGIKMYFAFKWVNPINGELLALVAGNFDLIPLDFSFIVSFDFSALLGTKLMMGLLIRPIIINKIMALAEPAIKWVIFAFLYPVTLIIVGLLKALVFLIEALEKALKAYRAIVGEVKKLLKAFFAMALAQINAAQREIDKIQIALDDLKRTIDHEHYLCTEPCYAWWGWCCRGCARIGWVTICFPGFPVLKFTNSGCIWRIWRRIIACIAVLFLWIAFGILTAIKWIAWAFLELVKLLLKALMFVIMLLLKIPEIVMIAAMEVLKAAAKVIALMIKPFAQIDLFKPCIGCIDFDHECFWERFMNKAVLLRIYEIAVAMEFSIKTVTFSGSFHIIIMSKEIDLVVSFSLSIEGLIEFFKTFVLKIFKEIMSYIVNAFACDTSVKAHEDETAKEEAAIDNHAKSLEANMDKAGHRDKSVRRHVLDASFPVSASGGDGLAATLRANYAALGGRRRELPPDASDEEAVREVRGYGPHARLWHPRAMENYSFGESAVDLGSLGGVGGGGGVLGMTFVGNSAGDLDLMKVGSQAGDLASRTERELHAHASLAAHVSALMSRAWPAHAAARASSSSSSSSSSSEGGDSRYKALLGADVRALRRASDAPAEALVAAFDSLATLDGDDDDVELGLGGASTSARTSTSGGGALRRALEYLMPDLGEGTRAAVEAAPEVFAACIPSPDAPLRAAAAALGNHAVGQGQSNDKRRLEIAARHENAGDALAAHLGTPRGTLDALHDENPTATSAAAAAALAAARDPCAVAGTLAALQCGAHKAGVEPWGETMTGCVHALDILSTPKCTGGVEDDLLDSFPGSSANNAEGRAHNGVDSRACVEAAVRHTLPCSEKCNEGLLGVASACGGLMPRAGRWRHDAAPEAEARCSSAVTAAHDTCGAHSRACQAVLEAVPLRDSLYFATRPTRYAAAHRARLAKLGQFDISQDELAPPADTLEWSEQNVWGVVPEETCHDDRMKIDARGNNLQGRPPSCAWEAARGGSNVLLSRNRLSGHVKPLAKDVAGVHVGFNQLQGDAGDVFGAAAAARLTSLVANDNKFKSRDGLARIAGAPKLANLDLSSNSLGPAGSAELADHLASLTSLTHYDVGGNNWDHAAVARGAVAAADAATAAPGHVALHAQITMPSSAALQDACGACPNFDRDISGSKLGARSAIRTCMVTEGCRAYASNVQPPEDMAGNADYGQTSAPTPRMFEAMACSLRAVLEPRLVHVVADRLAAAAAEREEEEDDDDDVNNAPPTPTTFAEAMEKASAWRVEVVEAAQQAEASGDGFVVGYTLTPAATTSSSSSTITTSSSSSSSRRSLAQMVANALERLQHAGTAELSAAASQCAGLHDAAATSGEDERATAAAKTVRSHLHEAEVDVRGACPTGRMGAGCSYVCQNEWHRTASHVAERGGHSLLSGAPLTGDANPTSGLRGAGVRTPPHQMHPGAGNALAASAHSEMVSRALITKSNDDDGDDDDAALGGAGPGGFRGAYASSGHGNADPVMLGRAPEKQKQHQRHANVKDMHHVDPTEGDGQYECSPEDAVRGHCHHMDHWNPAVAHEFVGGDSSSGEARPVLAYELEHCTTTCRGHANLAVSDCKMWLVDKSNASHRTQCRDAVRDMLHTCKIHQGLYHKYGERHVEACAGKGSRAFARLGKEREEHESGCEVCGIVHYFEGHGLSDDDHHPETGASLGSKFRKHRTFDMYDSDAGRRSNAVKLSYDTEARREDPEWGLAHKTRGLEGHDDVEEVKAKHFEKLLGFAPGDGMSVLDHPALARDDVYEHSPMFPTCSVRVGCSHRCYTHMHGVVMRQCMAWIDGDVRDVQRRDACQSAVAKAPAACTSSERAVCVDSVTVGFEALFERHPRADANDNDDANDDADFRGDVASSSYKKKNNNNNNNNNNQNQNNNNNNNNNQNQKNHNIKTQNQNKSNNNDKMINNNNNKVASSAAVTHEASKMGASSTKASPSSKSIDSDSDSESDSDERDVDYESNSTTTDEDNATPPSMLPMQMQSFLIYLVVLVVVAFILLRLISSHIATLRGKCREPSETEALLGGGSSDWKTQYGTGDDPY